MELVSNEICLQTLRGCALSKRRGLSQEVAIMLAVLSSDGPTTAARKACADLYDAADEGSTEASGRTFRAIRYRVDACVALHAKIGIDAILDMIGEKRGVKAINILTDHVASLNFFSIEALLMHCGKKEAPAEKMPAPGSHGKTIHVKTKHIAIDIPEDIDPVELEQLSMKLLRLAKKVRKASQEPAHQEPANDGALEQDAA